MKTRKAAVGITVFAMALLAFSTSASAQRAAARYIFETYDQASKSPTFIRFNMKSTKLGMLTTSFDGYVKNFSIQGMLNVASAEKISVSFPVNEIDTDVDARNEKLQSFCLEVEKYPLIKLRIEEPVQIDGKGQSLEGIIVVRGEEKLIFFDVTVTRREKDLLVHGVAQTKISELGIPDPSIWIASVDDQIDIEFKVIFPYEAINLASLAPTKSENN